MFAIHRQRAGPGTWLARGLADRRHLTGSSNPVWDRPLPTVSARLKPCEGGALGQAIDERAQHDWTRPQCWRGRRGVRAHSSVREVNMVGWSHALRLPPIVLKDRFLAAQETANEGTSL